MAFIIKTLSATRRPMWVEGYPDGAMTGKRDHAWTFGNGSTAHRAARALGLTNYEVETVAVAAERTESQERAGVAGEHRGP